MASETREATGVGNNNPGPYLAKIVSFLDPAYMGNLQVQILSEVGTEKHKEGELHQVRYMSPFMGYTGSEFATAELDYNNSQKSYGLWMIPPDVGSIVMVIFVQGDPKKGYWIGCVHNAQNPGVNFMTPGYASTTYNNEDVKKRLPVAEFNLKSAEIVPLDLSKTKKAIHPFKDILDQQGLLLDDIRGITSSSARREWPSAVFGISTPGPIDKQNGAKKAKTGKTDNEATTFVSRLGGSSFVMDDGDDKFLRKKTAGEGPPEYVSVEGKEEGGDVTIPHNELIRLRTRTGHQILLHNSEDLIYIGNARGTTWIEMTSNGKIDIYAEDSISVHTKNDLNFYADRDINMECGRNFNTKVGGEMQTEVVADQNTIIEGNQSNWIQGNVNTTIDGNHLHKNDGNFNLKTGGNVKITTDGNVDISTGGDNKLTASGNSDFSSGGNNVITAGGALDIKSGGASKWTGGGATSIGGASLVLSASKINLNGPAAPTAATAAEAEEAEEAELPKVLKTHSVPDETGSTLFDTIMRRVPTHEPWAHHENLDPEQFTPEKTDRDIDGRNEDNSESILLVDKNLPEYWSGNPDDKQKYTTITDTFAKINKERQ
jgi:hypothetical protein